MKYRLLFYMVLLLFTTGVGLVIWAIGGQALDYKTAGVFIMGGGIFWFIFIMYLESRLEEAEIELKGIYRDYYFLPKAIHKGKVLNGNVALLPNNKISD